MLLKVLLTFLKIGFFSYGGGYAIIPLIQEEVVDSLQWISAQTFNDIIIISQMTPGPLAVNTSTFVGLQVAGVLGAILATIGCIFSGVIISLALYRFFMKHCNSTYIFEILNSLKSASLGLIMSAALTILVLAFYSNNQVDLIAILIFTVSLFILRKWKINPILLMILTGIGGLFFYL